MTNKDNEMPDEIWAMPIVNGYDDYWSTKPISGKETQYTRTASINDDEIKRLRRALDNIKVRGYDQNRRDFHDMALAALLPQEGES